ncbi:MAG: sodium:proton antiporter NhaD, partial [Desulfatitalea sp.]|nr:sodium:proton antiporter NhaD [Desulfatitalea sp.]
MKLFAIVIFLLSLSAMALAAEFGAAPSDLAHSFWGYLSLVLFGVAYCLVPLENKIHLRKSKPVIAAAGLIWVLLAIAYARIGDVATAGQALRGNLIEYAELFLFLLVAMTYINAMEERHVFQALRAWLVSRGYSLRSVF